MTIDLDELLHGKPTPDQVKDFFEHGEFCDEHYLVEAIETHLQSEDDRRAIFDLRLSIEKILNGRYSGDHEAFVFVLLDKWNKKLGYEFFSV